MHVFEPIAEFVSAIAVEFADNRKVRVHAFGLLDPDGEQPIKQSADASSHGSRRAEWTTEQAFSSAGRRLLPHRPLSIGFQREVFRQRRDPVFTIRLPTRLMLFPG